MNEETYVHMYIPTTVGKTTCMYLNTCTYIRRYVRRYKRTYIGGSIGTCILVEGWIKGKTVRT